MSFKGIKGQDRVIEFFRNSVNRHRLAHAYLFAGPESVGKTLLAKNLAKFLNCENLIKEKDLFVDCCDSCISCRKIDDYNHPDVHWIESGQSRNISIDEIRAARKEISLKAYEGNFKVFVILQAHSLTDEAANCLLKTLEEPPASSILILTSTNISALLPTIISRCQIIKFSPLKYEKLKEILKEDFGLQPEVLHFLSSQAQGSIGKALGLRDQDILGRKNRLLRRVCQGQGGHFLFDIKDKEELVAQIRYLLNWFRDILILKAGLPLENIINADRPEEIKSRAKFYSFADLEQIITKIIQAHRMIEQNVNPKIALEAMLVGIKKNAGSSFS